jgi:hypothetical protein
MATNAPLVAVSQETHDNATAFINPVDRMLDLIDDLRFSEDQRLTDGMYLKMMNTVSEINKLKREIQNTVIYVETTRHARAPVRARKKASEMRDDPNYMACPRCKKYMTKRHYQEKHSRTKTCGHIEGLRKLNAVKGTGNKKNKKKSAPPPIKIDANVDIEATIVLLNDLTCINSYNEYEDNYDKEFIWFWRHPDYIGLWNVYEDVIWEQDRGVPKEYITQTPNEASGKYRKLKSGKWKLMKKKN